MIGNATAPKSQTGQPPLTLGPRLARATTSTFSPPQRPQIRASPSEMSSKNAPLSSCGLLRADAAWSEMLSVQRDVTGLASFWFDLSTASCFGRCLRPATRFNEALLSPDLRLVIRRRVLRCGYADLHGPNRAQEAGRARARPVARR